MDPEDFRPKLDLTWEGQLRLAHFDTQLALLVAIGKAARSLAHDPEALRVLADAYLTLPEPPEWPQPDDGAAGGGD